jgi:hypothetical protein
LIARIAVASVEDMTVDGSHIIYRFTGHARIPRANSRLARAFALPSRPSSFSLYNQPRNRGPEPKIAGLLHRHQTF